MAPTWVVPGLLLFILISAMHVHQTSTWKSPVVIEAHMHAAVEHDILSIERHQNTALANILACPQRSHFYDRHLLTMSFTSQGSTKPYTTNVHSDSGSKTHL